MPVDFNLLASRGLVYLRYDGFVTVAEAMDALEEYKAHPQFHPGHKHLADFSRITGFEHDYVKVFALQAEVAAALVQDGYEILLVMLAQSGPALEMAHLVRKSWEGVTTVVPRVAETEAQALALLGQPETTTDDLMRLLAQES
ncbi:hypothetical protein AB3Y40_08770 [Yoonia sp. R2331]|uniref:hypothetical protein n=1 Tax=Yoonia sp. R2331 TaxID=3237238 RepID=UPI0034E5D421